jgi:plastocyanin
MKAFYCVAALFFVALAAAPAACSSRASAQSAPPSAAAAAPVIIHMHDFMFDPDSVTVTAGTTVEWDNDDGARHTITAADKSFDSGDLKPGQKWSHVFATPGTYAYSCTQHPEMTATIVVK